MKSKKRRRIVAFLLVASALLFWSSWRPIANHLFGFAPSSSGGTRSSLGNDIRFSFDGPLQENGLPKPWQARPIVGKMQGSVVNNADGEKSLRITCDRAHFVLWYEAIPFDSSRFREIAWSWQAETLPPRGDSRTHAELPFIGDNRNDKALQLMVGFEGNYVLNYVWDSNAPVGFECDEFSPVATVKTSVVDSGLPTSISQWRTHKVDVYADFIHRFGKPPGKILGVGISSNTNHTASIGVGSVREIRAIASDSTVVRTVSP